VINIEIVQGGEQRMPLKDLNQEKFIRPTKEEQRFTAVVVDRDSMGSGLLADVLCRELNCDAIGVPSAELWRRIGSGKTDVVVISADLNFKPGTGFSLATSVSTAYPDLPIVILLEQPTQEATLDAFRTGARGVFNRQMSKSDFVDCVEHVRKGFIWAGGEETKFLLEALKSFPSSSGLRNGALPSLTEREMQVVRAAAKGNTNKAIAAELSLSEHTVKNYLFRAFEKLGVSSRVELLFYLTVRGYSFGPSMTQQSIEDVTE
jgi:DNA-binding NarL/FixJ family response regulator